MRLPGLALGVREEVELLTLPSTESPEEFYLERGHLVTLGAIDPWNQISSSAISISHCAAWKFPSVLALFSWWSLSWHKSPLSMCPNCWFGWESRRGPGLLMAAALTVVALEPGWLCTRCVAAWSPCSVSCLWVGCHCLEEPSALLSSYAYVQGSVLTSKLALLEVKTLTVIMYALRHLLFC